MLQPCSTQPSILSKNEAHVRPSCTSAESSNIFRGKSPWWRPFVIKKKLWLFFLEFLSSEVDANRSPRVSGTHLINVWRLKGWVDLRVTLWFWTWNPGLKILRLKSWRSRVYPCNFMKNDTTTEVFLHVFCKVALFKLSGNFLRDIFAKHSLTKFLGCDLIENNVFYKNTLNYVLTLTLKAIYTVLKTIFIVRRLMPMPMPVLMPITMPRCRCRDFATVPLS